MNNYVHFVVRAGSLEILSLDQFQCRGDNVLRILNLLVNRNPVLFEGKRGMAAFADSPPEDKLSRESELAFCSTKIRGEKTGFLEMPCPYSIGWPEVGIPDGEVLVKELLEISTAPRFPKIFWIGAETHYSRRLLCELSIHYPDILDAELMGWENPGGGVELSSNARYATLYEHADYKYLIDCAGVGYSGRLRWLLATGRPVFIVDRPVVEHWHDMLVPWEHYIPVKGDLSDLVQAYQEIETRPWVYDEISRNARAFVRENLLLERHLDRMLAKVETIVTRVDEPTG